MHWGVQDALYQAEQAMDDLLQNFPNRVVAGLLNVVIFPTGRHYLAPSDKLEKQTIFFQNLQQLYIKKQKITTYMYKIYINLRICIVFMR